MATSPTQADQIKRLQSEVRKLRRHLDAIIAQIPAAASAVADSDAAAAEASKETTTRINEQMSDYYRR